MGIDVDRDGPPGSEFRRRIWQRERPLLLSDVARTNRPDVVGRPETESFDRSKYAPSRTAATPARVTEISSWPGDLAESRPGDRVVLSR